MNHLSEWPESTCVAKLLLWSIKCTSIQMRTWHTHSSHIEILDRAEILGSQGSKTATPQKFRKRASRGMPRCRMRENPRGWTINLSKTFTTKKILIVASKQQNLKKKFDVSWKAFLSDIQHFESASLKNAFKLRDVCQRSWHRSDV